MWREYFINNVSLEKKRWKTCTPTRKRLRRRWWSNNYTRWETVGETDGPNGRRPRRDKKNKNWKRNAEQRKAKNKLVNYMYLETRWRQVFAERQDTRKHTAPRTIVAATTSVASVCVCVCSAENAVHAGIKLVRTQLEGKITYANTYIYIYMYIHSGSALASYLAAE